MKKQTKKPKSNNFNQQEIEESKLVVNEPAMEYQRNVPAFTEPNSNWVILNHGTKKPESQLSSFEKIAIIKEGITKTELESLKGKVDWDYNQLAQVFSVARATLINKKGKEKFDMGISEKIVSVADIYSYGYEVFEDESRFNNWIFRANKALGGQSPYDLLDNQYGREEVKNLIGRIDYGVYS